MGNSGTKPYYNPDVHKGRVRGFSGNVREPQPPEYSAAPVTSDEDVEILRQLLFDCPKGGPQLTVGLSLSPSIFQTADGYTEPEAVALATKAIAWYSHNRTPYRARKICSYRWEQVTEGTEALSTSVQ